jgi:hypothetical protein
MLFQPVMPLEWSKNWKLLTRPVDEPALIGEDPMSQERRAESPRRSREQ